jgi:alpha-D-xyloside xylohydrolase
MGRDIQNTSTTQAIREIRIYPGKDCEFTLYDDDGITYGYEKGQGRITRLRWDDVRKQLTAKGAQLSGPPVAELIKVIR